MDLCADAGKAASADTHDASSNIKGPVAFMHPPR